MVATFNTVAIRARLAVIIAAQLSDEKINRYPTGDEDVYENTTDGTLEWFELHASRIVRERTTQGGQAGEFEEQLEVDGEAWVLKGIAPDGDDQAAALAADTRLEAVMNGVETALDGDPDLNALVNCICRKHCRLF